jgi:CheY-like chemotaxis protein/signal transduction histidine kinase
MVATPDPFSERVLVLLPPGPDASLAAAVLDEAGMLVHPCADVGELCRQMQAGAGAALLAEEGLDPPALRALVAVLQQQDVWSDFPLVVFFGSVGPMPRTSLRMLGILEPLGNVTVLERPTRTMTLVSALQSAIRGRRRQYELRDLLRQREQALKDGDEFLTRLAHELRNPLGAIRSAAQVLEQLRGQDEVAAEQRAVVARQTERLGRLVDGVLSVHGLISGRIALRRRPVSLAEVLKRALRSAQPGARIQVEEGAPLLVEVDSEQLAQVFHHLLAEIAPAVPGLAVGAVREGNEAVVRIEAPGLDWPEGGRPAFLERLTEVLRLLDRPGGALRVGLLLVRNLVELHCGTVSAEAGDLVVRLPLLAGQQQPSRQEKDEAVGAGRRRVLVVEDNRDNRESLRLLLQMWGCDVETAGEGNEAVTRAIATRPEVALIDLGLPGLDGYEVARRLRREMGRDVLLVAVTGYGGPHERRQAAEAGFDLHLVKPLGPESLRDLFAGASTAGAARS